LSSLTPGSSPDVAPLPRPSPEVAPLPQPLSRGERGALLLENSKFVLSDLEKIKVRSLLLQSSPLLLRGEGPGVRSVREERGRG